MQEGDPKTPLYRFIRPSGVRYLRRAPWFWIGGVMLLGVGGLGDVSFLISMGAVSSSIGGLYWLIGSIQHALWFTAGDDEKR